MSRPGKRERARIKRQTKPSVWSMVLGPDAPFIKYGQHKRRRLFAYLDRMNDERAASLREPIKAESGQKSQTA